MGTPCKKYLISKFIVDKRSSTGAHQHREGVLALGTVTVFVLARSTTSGMLYMFSGCLSRCI